MLVDQKRTVAGFTLDSSFAFGDIEAALCAAFALLLALTWIDVLATTKFVNFIYFNDVEEAEVGFLATVFFIINLFLFSLKPETEAGWQ